MDGASGPTSEKNNYIETMFNNSFKPPILYLVLGLGSLVPCLKLLGSERDNGNKGIWADLTCTDDGQFKTRKWIADTYVEAESIGYVIAPKFGGRYWKAIFDHPHRNSDVSVYFRDQLLAKAKEIGADEEAVGLLFNHKLSVFRVMRLCVVFVGTAIGVAIWYGKREDRFDLGYATACFLLACAGPFLPLLPLVFMSVYVSLGGFSSQRPNYAN